MDFTLFLSIILLFINLLPTEAQIGVCYGWQGNNLPSRQQVVNIYKSNGIGRMRIYYPDHDILQALQGSGIKLLLDVPNDQVQNFAQNPSLANQWVQQNVVPYASVISYLAVGNEVDQNTRQYVGPAMSNALNALNANGGLGNQIKVTTSIGMSLIKNSYPPSAGEFNDLPFMVPIVNFLQQNGSPLIVNVYPYFTYVQNKGTVTLDYALFTSPGTVVFDPNGLQYQNLYDALVDSVYAALGRLGSNSYSNGPHVPVITGESNWPSGGGDSASLDLAGRYARGISHHAKYGTPRSPGPHQVYLFSMFDENQKPGDAVEQHFGLFTPDGQPKYSGVDFRS